MKAFPKDDSSKKPHLTAFMGYKAGMTHIVREIERPGSKLHKKDVVEPVTIIDCPPIVCVGVVGYRETPKGLQCVRSVWASHLSEECRRRFYKNWYCSKKKAYCKYAAHRATPEGKSEMAQQLQLLKDKCQVIRAICHTQIRKTPLVSKRAHIMEIQVNGGSVAEKVDFAVGLMEQEVRLNTVFEEGEMVDIIGVTKGHGTEGVIHRWGVTRLPRKTHRGLRKVACIGAWHPSRVQWQVPRSGQRGFHHRTEINKRVYRVGLSEDPRSGSTNADITEKRITPMGGWTRYGAVNNDFLMIKGMCPGPAKRILTIRKSLWTNTSRRANEPLNLKFVDTSAKRGSGRFQTSLEKQAFYGPRKHDVKAAAESA